MSQVDDLVERAMLLSEDERAEIAQRLYSSLSTDIDPEYAAEIERRIEEIAAGRMKLVPHSEVMAVVRERLNGKGS